MKIQIQTKNIIPVEIGELTFHVSMNDDSIIAMSEKFEEVGKELKEVKDNDIKEVKEVFIKALDVLLEEGAGAKIYEKYPSTLILNEITSQLLMNLTKEVTDILKNQTQLDIMKEYTSKM